jgi:hypothetical protein
MPHSIFFTKDGHAIHGSFEIKRLGTPASHGCVRLAPQNAAALFALVKTEGLANTKVVLTGEAPPLVAGRPAPREAAADPMESQQYRQDPYGRPTYPYGAQPQYGQPEYGQPQYQQQQYQQPQYAQPQPYPAQPRYQQQYGQPYAVAPRYQQPYAAQPQYVQPQPGYYGHDPRFDPRY